MDLIPGSGRSHGGGHDNPLQYSCLGNVMDRGAWSYSTQGPKELDTTEYACAHTNYPSAHDPSLFPILEGVKVLYFDNLQGPPSSISQAPLASQVPPLWARFLSYSTLVRLVSSLNTGCAKKMPSSRSYTCCSLAWSPLTWHIHGSVSSLLHIFIWCLPSLPITAFSPTLAFPLFLPLFSSLALNII